MKVAAARAIAALAQEPVPEDIIKAYGIDGLTFGKDYILPKPFDRRLLTVVAPAVISAAEESGVARKKIEDMALYQDRLHEIICSNDSLIAYMIKAQEVCCVH